MKKINTDKLEQIIKKVSTKKYIKGAVFKVSSGDNSINWSGSSGNLEVDSRYYIASINKLFLSSIILKLISNGKLSFDDPISKYLSKETMKGLHIYKGIDYSNDITIKHMISQTSGLPCYLSDKSSDGTCIMKDLEAGIDQPWTTEKIITRIKTMKPHFPPGKESKYVDTNHQLLNLIIEKILEQPISTILTQIFIDLDMKNTYVSHDLNDKSYVFPYYKDERRDISQFITSTKNDIISTADDQMKFIKAFYNGFFYPKDQLESLEQWNPIFFPFKYGIGIQKFYMPRFLSPFKAVPDMLGHCGSTGTVAYYIKEKDIYITGTTNQQARPNVAFQTLIKIIHSL